MKKITLRNILLEQSKEELEEAIKQTKILLQARDLTDEDRKALEEQLAALEAKLNGMDSEGEGTEGGQTGQEGDSSGEGESPFDPSNYENTAELVKAVIDKAIPQQTQEFIRQQMQKFKDMRNPETRKNVQLPAGMEFVRQAMDKTDNRLAELRGKLKDKDSDLYRSRQRRTLPRNESPYRDTPFGRNRSQPTGFRQPKEPKKPEETNGNKK